ncbi:hypothetical protein ASE99_01605 [Serratia sp. Leaf51]|nr:hypothetical protein ASE99_01605 [Serratia sp. Leaf51]
MAITTCPKCPNTSFEIKETSIKGANFRMYFIQCSACGAAIGVQPFYDTNALLKSFAKKLGHSL